MYDDRRLLETRVRRLAGARNLFTRTAIKNVENSHECYDRRSISEGLHRPIEIYDDRISAE